ncbi:ATP-binding cassette domain-containing protein [Candidatus Poribacteria bacterium]|nr:ATP-binding cassette domain-containing protein [Candidatus Poribacteria bacterium]
MNPLLEIRNMDHYFAGLKAVSDFNLSLQNNEIVGLIGPNGAGKTTVFNLITGLHKPTSGEIIFRKQPIHGQKPYIIAELGIARTFQNIRLFLDMTVIENIKVAYHYQRKYGIFSAFMSSKSAEEHEIEMSDAAIDLLEIFDLDKYAQNKAGSLPYGQQRKLEIARALATQPALILLDEPAAGMNPVEADQLLHTIHDLRNRFKVTILMIEHQMRVVMGVCERIKVMDFGETIAEGLPEEIQKNEKVIKAYLGENT